MAIDFPGVDEYINCGSGATLDDISSKTVACWINTDGVGAGTLVFVDKYNGAGGWLFFRNAAKISYYHAWAGVGQWISNTASLTAGVWYHVAVTYDKTGAAPGNDPVLYINGISQAVVESNTPTGAVGSDAAFSLGIGARVADTNSPLDGRLEDVRVFNRILSAQEVAILAGGYRGPLGGEVGWWAMDGAQAIAHFDAANLTVNVNYIPDMSGNANTGNPTGTPIGAASACPRMGGIID